MQKIKTLWFVISVINSSSLVYIIWIIQILKKTFCESCERVTTTTTKLCETIKASEQKHRWHKKPYSCSLRLIIHKLWMQNDYYEKRWEHVSQSLWTETDVQDVLVYKHQCFYIKKYIYIKSAGKSCHCCYRGTL